MRQLQGLFMLGAMLFLLSAFSGPIQGTLLPSIHEANLSAVDTAASRISAGTGVLTGSLSYCAHWFARNGTACISTGKAGELVVVDTGIPTGSSGAIASAASNCQRTGCKVALYCECTSAAHVQQVATIYARFVAQFPGIMLPQVEVDGIRDIPSKKADVARALGGHGLSLIVKNDHAVDQLSQYTPVARVMYEDIGRTGSYLGEFKALAAAKPSLLLSGILHQGSHASDLGGSAYPGTSAAEAQEIFKELEHLKNVELFYGTSSGYQKIKAFDGSMAGAAREEGYIKGRFSAQSGQTAPPSPMNTNSLAQLLGGTAPSRPIPQTSPFSSNAQPFQFLQNYSPATTEPIPSPIIPQYVSTPNTVTYTVATITPVTLGGIFKATPKASSTRDGVASTTIKFASYVTVAQNTFTSPAPSDIPTESITPDLFSQLLESIASMLRMLSSLVTVR